VIPGRPVPGSLQRLAEATRDLAATVAATERLAERRAELLRTMDAAVGMNGRGSHADSRAIVSLSEVARRTGRHPEVLRRWCADGRIPAVRVGRTWAVSGDTLAMLLAHASRSRPRFPQRDGDR
jgi:excisionase family DNA binding protein